MRGMIDADWDISVKYYRVINNNSTTQTVNFVEDSISYVTLSRHELMKVLDDTRQALREARNEAFERFKERKRQEYATSWRRRLPKWLYPEPTDASLTNDWFQVDDGGVFTPNQKVDFNQERSLEVIKGLEQACKFSEDVHVSTTELVHLVLPTTGRGYR